LFLNLLVPLSCNVLDIFGIGMFDDVRTRNNTERKDKTGKGAV